MTKDNLRAVCLASLLGVFSVDCCLSTELVTPRQVRSPKQHDMNDDGLTRDTLERILSVTYQVETEGYYVINKQGILKTSRGSAVAVHDDGKYSYYFTAAHVLANKIEENNPVVAKQYILVGKDRYEADVVKKDDDKDLVLLRSKHRVASFSTFCNEKEVLPGDIVIGAGYPLVFGKQFSFGRIVGAFGDFYMADAHLDFGFSGGPYFVVRRGKPKLLGLATFATQRGSFTGISRTEGLKSMLYDALKVKHENDKT